MGAGKRRVDISFDRERDALRAIASAVARVSGLPIPVPVAPPTSPPPAGAPPAQPPSPPAPPAAAELPVAAAPPPESDLARFARELQARSEALARSTEATERPARPRTPAGRPIERRAVSRHAAENASPSASGQPMPERRGSQRSGTIWSPSADRRSAEMPSTPSDATTAQPAPAASASPTAAPAEAGKPLRVHLFATDVATQTPPPDAPTVAPERPAVAPGPLADLGSHPNAARYLGSLVAAYGPLDPADESDAAWPLVDLLVIDASALAALARGNVRARAHLSRAVGSLARIVVPAAALADAAHARVAHAVGEIEPVDEANAKLAARLIAQTGRVAPSTAFAAAAATRGASAAILTADVTPATAYTRTVGRPGLYVFAV